MNIDDRTTATPDQRDVSARYPERSDRLSRITPLSGVAFFVLLLGSAVTSPQPPDEFSSGAKVVSFFTAHQNAEKLSDLLGGLSVVFLVLFASSLRAHLRSRGAGALGSAVFGGAIILAVGGATRAGIGYALAAGHDKLEPGAAQVLNVLFSSHHPAVIGIAVLMFAVFAENLRTSALPTGLGWAALPIGLIAVGPPTLIPLIATGVWVMVTGIVLFVRGRQLSPISG